MLPGNRIDCFAHRNVHSHVMCFSGRQPTVGTHCDKRSQVRCFFREVSRKRRKLSTQPRTLGEIFARVSQGDHQDLVGRNAFTGPWCRKAGGRGKKILIQATDSSQCPSCLLLGTVYQTRNPVPAPAMPLFSKTSQKFVAKLSGASEVPPVSTLASGKAVFTYDSVLGAISFTLDVSHIKSVTGAHIHLGAVGVTGPVVATLFGPVPKGTTPTHSVLAAGTLTAASLTGPLAGKTIAALVAEFEKGTAYVDVHTLAHPTGEIRGQVTSSSSSLCPCVSPCTSSFGILSSIWSLFPSSPCLL